MNYNSAVAEMTSGGMLGNRIEFSANSIMQEVQSTSAGVFKLKEATGLNLQSKISSGIEEAKKAYEGVTSTIREKAKEAKSVAQGVFNQLKVEASYIGDSITESYVDFGADITGLKKSFADIRVEESTKLESNLKNISKKNDGNFFGKVSGFFGSIVGEKRKQDESERELWSNANSALEEKKKELENKPKKKSWLSGIGEDLKYIGNRFQKSVVNFGANMTTMPKLWSDLKLGFAEKSEKFLSGVAKKNEGKFLGKVAGFLGKAQGANKVLLKAENDRWKAVNGALREKEKELNSEADGMEVSPLAKGVGWLAENSVEIGIMAGTALATGGSSLLVQGAVTGISAVNMAGQAARDAEDDGASSLEAFGIGLFNGGLDAIGNGVLKGTKVGKVTDKVVDGAKGLAKSGGEFVASKMPKWSKSLWGKAKKGVGGIKNLFGKGRAKIDLGLASGSKAAKFFDGTGKVIGGVGKTLIESIDIPTRINDTLKYIGLAGINKIRNPEAKLFGTKEEDALLSWGGFGETLGKSYLSSVISNGVSNIKAVSDSNKATKARNEKYAQDIKATEDLYESELASHAYNKNRDTQASHKNRLNYRKRKGYDTEKQNIVDRRNSSRRDIDNNYIEDARAYRTTNSKNNATQKKVANMSSYSNSVGIGMLNAFGAFTSFAAPKRPKSNEEQGAVNNLSVLPKVNSTLEDVGNSLSQVEQYLGEGGDIVTFITDKFTEVMNTLGLIKSDTEEVREKNNAPINSDQIVGQIINELEPAMVNIA